MLRTSLAAAAVLAVAAPVSALPARVVEAPYAVAMGAGDKMAEWQVAGQSLGAAKVLPRKGERRASFTAEDATGMPVRFVVWQDAAGDDVVLGEFCGATPKPLALRGTGEVTVFVIYGACGAGVSVPTTGLVRAGLA